MIQIKTIILLLLLIIISIEPFNAYTFSLNKRPPVFKSSLTQVYDASIHFCLFPHRPPPLLSG